MPLTRRHVLIGAGGLASGLVFGGSVASAVGEVQTVISQGTMRKMKVIVAGGHPGDPEYGCGGTIARLTNLGHEVVLLYLNDGAWPPTSASTRIAEAKKACELLRARPAYAGQVNGDAMVDKQHYEAYAKIIDTEKPDVLFSQWPIDNHRDHRAIAMLTYDAWRQSKKNFALYYYEVPTERIPCNSLLRTTSIYPKRSRSNVLPVTLTPARPLIGTTRCRTRWPLFEG